MIYFLSQVILSRDPQEVLFVLILNNYFDLIFTVKKIQFHFPLQNLVTFFYTLLNLPRSPLLNDVFVIPGHLHCPLHTKQDQQLELEMFQWAP